MRSRRDSQHRGIHGPLARETEGGRGSYAVPSPADSRHRNASGSRAGPGAVTRRDAAVPPPERNRPQLQLRTGLPIRSRLILPSPPLPQCIAPPALAPSLKGTCSLLRTQLYPGEGAGAAGPQCTDGAGRAQDSGMARPEVGLRTRATPQSPARSSGRTRRWLGGSHLCQAAPKGPSTALWRHLCNFP